MQGIINLDKPSGASSARLVARVKRLLPRGTKIGHAGTLDPFATGVLLLLVGKATRSCEQLMDMPKQYEAVVRFGATTETDDPESPPVAWTPATGGPLLPLHEQAVRAALQAFVGQIMQRPPVYSALKVGGRRAYALARRGQPADLPPRPVTVYGLEVLQYAWPLLALRIDCGRGTYIRSLARDLGRVLDAGGHLASLRRTRVGPYRIEDAVTVETLEQNGVGLE